MVLKDVRQIISELARIKKSIPPTEDVGRYLPDVRVNVRGEGERCGIKKALRLIEQAPTIDAVPVVRCRECKHRGYDFCPMCHDEYTYDEDDGGDYFTVDNTTDDGFCHMGAKMDGGA